MPQLQGISLLLLGPNNWLRLQLARVVGHPWFEHFLLLLIFLSSITLALDTPGLDADSKLKHALGVSAAARDDVVMFSLATMLYHSRAYDIFGMLDEASEQPASLRVAWIHVVWLHF